MHFPIICHGVNFSYHLRNGWIVWYEAWLAWKESRFQVCISLSLHYSTLDPIEARRIYDVDFRITDAFASRFFSLKQSFLSYLAHTRH